MTTDTTRTVAALRRLAEAEEPCPGDNTIHEGCFVCNGTSRVPLFRSAEDKPLLRKRCGCLEWGERFRNEFEHTEDTGDCGGLGWHPVNVNEVHLEMLLLLAINNEHESLAGGQLFYTLMSALETRARSAKTEQDLIEAAILALDAAMEVRT